MNMSFRLLLAGGYYNFQYLLLFYPTFHNQHQNMLFISVTGLIRNVFNILLSQKSEGHLPGHSSQRGMMSLHDHKFSHAYQLLGARSIHQYILQGNHFY